MGSNGRSTGQLGTMHTRTEEKGIEARAQLASTDRKQRWLDAGAQLAVSGLLLAQSMTSAQETVPTHI